MAWFFELFAIPTRVPTTISLRMVRILQSLLVCLVVLMTLKRLDPMYITPEIVARYKLELDGCRVMSHTSISITDSDPGSVLSISDDDDDDDDDEEEEEEEGEEDTPPANPLHIDPPVPPPSVQYSEPLTDPSSQEQNRVPLERSLQDLTSGTILDDTIPKLNQVGIHTLLDLKEAFSLVKPGQEPDRHPFWARLIRPGHLSVLQLYKLHDLFHVWCLFLAFGHQARAKIELTDVR
jgi:hypothetical protein